MAAHSLFPTLLKELADNDAYHSDSGTNNYVWNHFIKYITQFHSSRNIQIGNMKNIKTKNTFTEIIKMNNFDKWFEITIYIMRLLGTPS